jgi:superfamily II DNA or RNA helicase
MQPGAMKELNTAIRPGSIVRARGDRWRVERIDPFERCAFVHLAPAGGSSTGRPRVLIAPFDRPTPIVRLERPRLVSRRSFIRALRRVIQDEAPWGSLRTSPHAAFELLPYQLEPALAILEGRARRVLLADEVGLGKTIQAGLVLSELWCRGDASRALIVTPAGLRDQWADELAARFSMAADVIDAAALARLARGLPPGANPWSLCGIRIVSIDFLKQPEVLQGAAAIAWDVVVFDEAHGLVGGSERERAARVIAAGARCVLLVTATPHAGDEQAFGALCALGAAGDPIAVFRRTREEVGIGRERRICVLRVRPTRAERAMHAALDAYTHLVWRSSPPELAADARLAMMVLAKRAMSSASSLARSLERRLDALARRDTTAFERQLPLSFADEPIDEDDEPSAVLGAPGLADADVERHRLARVLARAREAGAAESKRLRLMAALARTREPAIVFTEFRDTAMRLADALEARWPVALLHGGLTRAERRLAEGAFTSGRARILVATDAASEGLNLHARCRWVIDYELPWNPVRLEQRIGRVDRIGQARTVHALHLVGRGTGETRVLTRLVERVGRIRAALGHAGTTLGGLTERQLAEVAIARGELPRELSAATRSESPRRATTRGRIAIDLRARAETETSRLLQLRRFPRDPSGGATAAALERRGPWVHLCRHRTPLPRGALLLFRATLVDGASDAIDRVLVPVLARCPRIDRRNLGSPAWDDLVRAGRAAAIACLADRLDSIAPRHRALVEAALVSEEALARVRGSRRVPVQHSLFPNRTASSMTGYLSDQPMDDPDRDRRIDRLQRSRDVGSGDAELLLVLVGR